MTFAYVLFDLDGTLTDSAAGIVTSYHYALSRMGLSAGDDEIRRLIGPPLAAGMRRLGVPDDRVDEAVALYREYFSVKGIYENRLYEGIPEILRHLHSSGAVLGLATSKPTPFAETILGHFQLSQFFGAICGATLDGSRLHKEDIASHALACLGAPDPAGVALVGDREQDMFAARELGLYAIGVLWGYGTSDELSRAGAQVLVASPTALLPVLLWDRAEGLLS